MDKSMLVSLGYTFLGNVKPSCETNKAFGLSAKDASDTTVWIPKNLALVGKRDTSSGRVELAVPHKFWAANRGFLSRACR